MLIDVTIALSTVFGKISRQKNIYSEKFLAQKMEYIHQNPVAKDWELVQDRAEYRYSSACFYDKNQQPIIDVDDIRELLYLE